MYFYFGNEASKKKTHHIHDIRTLLAGVDLLNYLFVGVSVQHKTSFQPIFASRSRLCVKIPIDLATEILNIHLLHLLATLVIIVR